MSGQPSIPGVPSELAGPGESGHREEARAPPARPGAAPSRRRVRVLLILMALTALAYLAVLHSFNLAERPSEQRFGAGAETAPRVRIYLEPLAVDPVEEEMQIRVDIVPGRGLLGTRTNTPKHDLTVILTTGDSVEERVFHANEPMTPTTVRADLTEGSIVHYPIDRYRIDLRFQALEGAGTTPATGRPVAEEVTVWEGLLGYRLRTRQVPGSGAGDIRLRLDLRRTAAHVFFALAAYGAMVVLACSSLTISTLVFLGRRKVEATLVGALAALVFALPALRNALPGAPPLGVWADLAVFLWAELAAVLGAALLVLSWAWHAPDR